VGKKRKEASKKDTRDYAKQFSEAKRLEYQSWLDNDVFELIDVRKVHVKNFVSGRWVLTIKRDKDGNFIKCKARWVLRGFQDKQKETQQTDSPAATRPGFRCAAQAAANNRWDIYHIDLKTAFLQGEAYDETRDVYCELPKESGLPWYMAARMKKPAYGLNDAPRRWWNIIDGKLITYGLVPTRADRCTYVLYGEPAHKNDYAAQAERRKEQDPIDYLLDPVSGNNAQGRQVHGTICLHVDDLFMAGDDYFTKSVLPAIRRDFQIGSEDKNDVMFVGQRIRWIMSEQPKGRSRTAQAAKLFIKVDQNKQIEELSEITFDKSMQDHIECSPALHSQYRSLLGQINWLQSRTQVQACYRFSRCASAASKPTIGDVRALNKLARQIRAQPVELKFWPLNGKTRILGYPDASYRNNEDKSSQRAHVIFIAQDRVNGSNSAQADTWGSLVDYESHKITTTTMSTTVAELNALMRCFGSCLFLRGLWADISGEICEIHLRTDANNLVTTASTTHLPEQKETIHLIQMLRKEACSGQIHDLAHVVSSLCLADSLTKSSAHADQLVKTIDTGLIEKADEHKPFRSMLQHKAFVAQWLKKIVSASYKCSHFANNATLYFLGEEIEIK
jgi:hypothetical protein